MKPACDGTAGGPNSFFFFYLRVGSVLCRFLKFVLSGPLILWTAKFSAKDRYSLNPSSVLRQVSLYIKGAQE